MKVERFSRPPRRSLPPLWKGEVQPKWKKVQPPPAAPIVTAASTNPAAVQVQDINVITQQNPAVQIVPVAPIHSTVQIGPAVPPIHPAVPPIHPAVPPIQPAVQIGPAVPPIQPAVQIGPDARSYKNVSRLVQTDHSNLEKEMLLLKMKVKALKNQLVQMEKKLNDSYSMPQNPTKFSSSSSYFSYSDCKDDVKKFKFYTGLSYDKFIAIWHFLGPAAYRLNYWNRDTKNKAKSPSKKPGPTRKLEPINEFFLTLVRLRLGCAEQDLAYRFGVSQTLVSTIVITWIQFLYVHFSSIKDQLFPPRSVMQKYKPSSFNSLRNIRVTIDCTEIFTQEAADFQKQGNTYSSYKSHTTHKVLVGCSPNGALCFISDAYEGSISDNEIVNQSGFLDYINPGDLVLADRGFLIKEELMKKKAYLNIPPFLGNRQRFTKQEEIKTKKIAKLRIHVERIIERMKKYRVIKYTVPSSLNPLVSQIVFVIGMLVNHQIPIVR